MSSFICAPHVLFHGQQFTYIFSFTVSCRLLLSCYFCSLLLDRSVDQITVLLLPFSVVGQVCGSNHCPVTSVLCCWTSLSIKPLSCYFCSVLLDKSDHQTTVLFLLFSAVGQVCRSDHCPVTSVLCCWTILSIRPLSCSFCSLLLDNSVDQTTVLFLLFSTVGQFC